MKTVTYLALVDIDKCKGDKLCEKICPGSAIQVMEKIAGVGDDKCVACGKCLDVCREGAVSLVLRPEPLILEVNTEEADQGKIAEICRKAHCAPDQFICVCTGTTAKEVAAGILQGAKSPEDIVRSTGAGSGCGIYCMGVVFRIFKAAGVEIPDDPRWFSLSLAVWDIPPKVAAKYPKYCLGEDQKTFSQTN